eukprot:1160176-Pelagomonas_calceolata.AAC.20
MGRYRGRPRGKLSGTPTAVLPGMHVPSGHDALVFAGVYGIAGARGVAGTHALFCWVWLAPSESSVWYCWCDSMIGALQGFSQNLAPLIFLKCVAATCCAPSLQRQRLGDGRDPRGNSNNPIRTGKGKSKASEDDRVLSYLLGPPLDKALTALASAEAKASSTQVAKHAGSTARLKGLTKDEQEGENKFEGTASCRWSRACLNGIP